jgi:hypothetical protein
MSKEPFWLVGEMTAAGFFTQKRRDAAHAAVSKAFVDVLGDDGSSGRIWGPPSFTKVAVAPLLSLVEIPEGSWGSSGAKCRRSRPAALLAPIRIQSAGLSLRST